MVTARNTRTSQQILGQDVANTHQSIVVQASVKNKKGPCGAVGLRARRRSTADAQKDASQNQDLSVTGLAPCRKSQARASLSTSHEQDQAPAPTPIDHSNVAPEAEVKPVRMSGRKKVKTQRVMEMSGQATQNTSPSDISTPPRQSASKPPILENGQAKASTRTSARNSRRSPPRSSPSIRTTEESVMPQTHGTSNPVVGLRSTKSSNHPASPIPFPTQAMLDADLSQDAQQSACLIEADFQDERLMAVCAALQSYNNRALTAAEIGETCVQRGWIRPSPALSPANLVQSAIRTYQRRCATQQPERQCLIQKHILAGYAMEARLVPALHPSAAESSVRRKGLVYFLGGTYGPVTWDNPFETLTKGKAQEEVMAVLKQGQECQAKRNAINKRGKQAQLEKNRRSKTAELRREASQSVEATSGSDSEDEEESKIKGLKIKIKLGGVVNEPVGSSRNSSASELSDSDQAMSDDNSRKSCQTDSESGSSDQDTFDQLHSSAWAVAQPPADSDESDDDDILPQSTNIRDFARSFLMDGRLSPGSSSWTNTIQQPISSTSYLPPATRFIESYDDVDHVPALSPNDAIDGSSSEDDDEVATEMMDSVEFEDTFRASRKFNSKDIGFDVMDYRDILGARDVDGSEIDSPATTPRTPAENDFDDPKHLVCDKDSSKTASNADVDLQHAVHVLGGLLPSLSDPISPPLDIDMDNVDLMLPKTPGNQDASWTQSTEPRHSPVAPSVQSRRKSSVGARDAMQLSLPLSCGPGPSPLNSPFLLSGNQENPLSARPSLDTPVTASEDTRSLHSAKHNDGDEMDLLANLGEDLEGNECESVCVCHGDFGDHASLEADISGTDRDQGATLGTVREMENDDGLGMSNSRTAESWTELLGPESVGLDELDNVWGFMSAAVVVAAEKNKRRRRDLKKSSASASDSHLNTSKSHPPETPWGSIGVGSTSDESNTQKYDRAQFARALINRAKALTKVQLPSFACPQDSPRKNRSVVSAQVSDDEAIGMEDVADAVLSAWADGDTIVEDDSPADAFSPNPVDEDAEMVSTGFQFTPNHEGLSIGISPLDLTAPPHAFDTSSSPCVEEKLVESSPPQVSPPSDLPTRLEEPEHKEEGIASTIKDVTTEASTKESSTQPSERIAPKVSSQPPNMPVESETPVSSTRPSKGSEPFTAPGKVYVETVKPIWPPVHALVIDRISVFSILWRNKCIYRRIDSDYINFSALLQAVQHDHIEQTEDALCQLSCNVDLRETSVTGVCGVWLPLDIAETEAEKLKLDMHHEMKDVLFRSDLASLFPAPLPQIKVILCTQGRAMANRGTLVSGRLFGIPFGCMDELIKDSKAQGKTKTNDSKSLHASRRSLIGSVPSKRHQGMANATKTVDGPPPKRRKSEPNTTRTTPNRRLTRAQAGQLKK